MTMAAPRIAITIHSLDGGGAERMTLNLAEAFLARGLDVDLVLCRAEGRLLSSVPERARIVDCQARTSLEWRNALERFLAESPPETLLANMEGAGVVALWARQRARAGCRVAVIAHNVLSRHISPSAGFKERWLLPWFVRWFYPKADAIVAVSGGVADDLARTAWLRRDRIEVIYNPVVTDALAARAAARVEHPWLSPGGPPVILTAGRLTPQKDHATLLRAFALFAAQREARLMILGEGDERARLEALAGALGIAERVCFLSFVENPFAYMARADLFVLSSAWEGFGNVIVEAMACGTPVVSTDCPSGPAEILENGRYGPLVPVGDAEALASAMASTLDAPPGTEQLRARAMEFHAERAADAYLSALGLEGVPTRTAAD